MISIGSKPLGKIAVLLLWSALSPVVHAATVPSGECIGKDAFEPVWETYLSANPQDVTVAACLLDFYAYRLPFRDLMPRRTRLIRWVIENHPDILLTGHAEYGLRVDAYDTALIAEIRSLWLEQIARFPDSWRILLNAGQSFALADAELAASWLSAGRKQEPDNFELADALGHKYSNAIIGTVAAAGPELTVGAVDPAHAHSAFAQRAWVEANGDSLLATTTGRALHYSTNFLRYRGLSGADYDPLAEHLLERAQELDYPAPTRISALLDFYQEQAQKRGKPLERLVSRSRIVDLPPPEAAQRAATVLPYTTAGVRVACEIVVGTDGHVWSTLVTSAPSSTVAGMAQSMAADLVYRPLRVDDEPVRFRTTVTMAVEAGRVSYAQLP